MARQRLPQSKAEVSGATGKNPQRFRDRKVARAKPLGSPYLTMTDDEKVVWGELKEDMPWLNAGHRIIVRLACHHTARLASGAEFSVSATQVLSSLLSKLGATPVDETKVNHAEDGDEDPSDRFFASRPN